MIPRPLEEIIDAVETAIGLGVQLNDLPIGEWQQIIAAARRGLDSDRRATELLASNNETLEKYRATKRLLDEAEACIVAAAKLAGTMGKMIAEQETAR